MKDRIIELEKNLEICNQQIQVFQELQKLQSEETYRYYRIQLDQERNQILKGLGLALNNIGQILEIRKEMQKESDESEEELEE